MAHPGLSSIETLSITSVLCDNRLTVNARPATAGSVRGQTPEQMRQDLTGTHAVRRSKSEGPGSPRWVRQVAVCRRRPRRPVAASLPPRALRQWFQQLRLIGRSDILMHIGLGASMSDACHRQGGDTLAQTLQPES